jgi:hypothetical protein
VTVSEFPAAVKRIIDAYVASMDHVNVLLQLHEAPGRAMTVEDLVAEAHVDRIGVIRVLADFESAAVVRESDGVYRYTPAAADVAAISELSEMYRRRPVTLIRAVYARPVSVRNPLSILQTPPAS